MQDLPLSEKSKRLMSEILAIPMTSDPLPSPQPTGLTDDEIDTVYYGALEGAAWVVPMLQKLIKRFPDFPPLKNYLMIAYQCRNQSRQARKIADEIVKLHPDYLFGKLAASDKAMDSGHPEKVREILGADLDLRKLYPDQEIFHISELKNYYATVAAYYCATLRFDEALGIQAALRKLVPGDPVLNYIEAQIISANARRWQNMFAEEARTKIDVKTAHASGTIRATPPPEFHHPEIAALYAHDFDMPEDTIRKILALPRPTLVADLIRVLDDAVFRTPYFVRSGYESTETCFAMHAIHFLADLRAVEVLPAVLRLLSLHEDEISFWLGDFSHAPQLARICAGQIEEIKSWMKLPGISAPGKSHIASAVEFLAIDDPAFRGQALAFYEEILEFYLTCSRGDNILDTSLISYLVGDVLTLRATELQSLIERLWEKNYIMRVIVGDLDSILAELASPPSRNQPAGYLSISDRYRKLRTPVTLPSLTDPNKLDPVLNSFLNLPPAEESEDITYLPGRNDPCSCGSGRKFKKCCLSK